MAVLKHTSTLSFTQLGTLDLHEHTTPQSCRACTGETMRPTPCPLWTAEEGRRKDKGVRLSMSPGTQVKEQHVSVTSFLKMKWKKYWRFVNNSQSIHVSV